MWSSTGSLGKILNQSSLVSNFDALGINNPVAYGPNLPQVPVDKLQKYLKPVLQKLGTLRFPSPNGLGFQVQKWIMTNLKVGKKNFFITFLELFSPESPSSSIFELGFLVKINSSKNYKNVLNIFLQKLIPLRYFISVSIDFPFSSITFLFANY